MTLLEAVEELMSEYAFEECIYTEHGDAFWTLDSLYNVLLEGDAEDDDTEYDVSETGHIHRLKEDGELGRKVYRNLGEPVKFFTKLAKDEAKDRGVEVDAALLHQLSRDVEIGIDDEIIEAVLQKCRKKK